MIDVVAIPYITPTDWRIVNARKNGKCFVFNRLETKVWHVCESEAEAHDFIAKNQDIAYNVTGGFHVFPPMPYISTHMGHALA